MGASEHLPNPTVPLEPRDHCLGSPDAKNSVVEYGDYASPACRDVLGAVNELVRELGDDLCFAYRNFPQPLLNPRSRPAAEAAEAADLQGKFWLMHDRLFAHQDDLSDKAIREIARSLPVDLHHFERDLTSGETARRVDEDLASARKIGVAKTPTFFVNGRPYTGPHEFVPILEAVQQSKAK
jgi:Na+:H+ antiporter, NhaA family